jgi:hypothetical protein
MNTSKEGATIVLLAQQAVASSSGRRFVARSVRSIVGGRIERRTIVRQLGATIYSCGGRFVLRQVAELAAADGDPIGQLASHELLSGFWLDRKP